MKKRMAFLCALLLLTLACAFPAHAEEITPEQEEQYGFLGELQMKQQVAQSALIAGNAMILDATSIYGQDCARLYAFGPSFGYAASAEIPLRMKCEQARYVVVKYYNPNQVQELGFIWRCQAASAGYNTKNPKMAQLESSGNSWQYLIVDMSDHALWSGALYNFGFLLYSSDSGSQSLWLQWLKFYSEDPTELYAAVDDETFLETREWRPLPPMTEPVTEPPETTEDGTPSYPPDTTAPTESIVPDEEFDTWETVETREEPENKFGGLFFEVFGDDALAGCQGASLGCKGGGCNAVTGGLFVICLFAAGIVFRKHD